MIIVFSFLPLLTTAWAAYRGSQWTFASLIGIIVFCSVGTDLLAFGAFQYAHSSTNVCPYQCFDYPTDVQLDLICKVTSTISLLNWVGGVWDMYGYVRVLIPLLFLNSFSFCFLSSKSFLSRWGRLVWSDL